MLNWAITFFLIAIIAAFLGFGGAAGTAAGVGSLLLKVFLVLFVVGLLFRAVAAGATGGALFLLACGALFGWQIGGFMLRNRPRTYTFDALPKDLLP